MKQEQIDLLFHTQGEAPYTKKLLIDGLARLCALATRPYEGIFRDVELNDPCAPALQAAREEGFLAEEDGRVYPHAPVSTAMLLSLFSAFTGVSSFSVPSQDTALSCSAAGKLISVLIPEAEKAQFAAPRSCFRVYPMEHDLTQNPSDVDALLTGTYAGGAVINAPWKDGWNQNRENLNKLDKTSADIKKHGMGVWLYDEVVYPSGWANGYIEKDGTRHHARNLGILVVPGKGTASFSQGLPENGHRFVWACVCPAENGEPLTNACVPAEFSDKEVSFRCPEGAWFAMAFYIRPCNIWPYAFATTIDPPIGPREHLNFLEKDAVAAFLEGALDPVAHEIPDFGDRFEAVFTDEPALQSTYIFGHTNKPSFRSVPYGDELFEEFRRLFGCALEPLLPYLFFGNTPEAKVARVRFYRAVSSLLQRNFTGQAAAWCHRHGVHYSGHMHGEECLYFHVGNYGDYMSVLSHQDWPGFDMLEGQHSHFFRKGEGINNTGAAFLSGKYTSGISRQKGHNTTMVELCPVAHQDELLKNADTIFDGLMSATTDAVFTGATRINAYGYHFLHDPEQFRRWNEYTGRLCTVLRQADSDAKIAVYYPIEDAQAAHYSPDTAMNELSRDSLRLNNYCEGLVYLLNKNRLDFNFVTSEGILKGSLTDSGLHIGRTDYRILLFPRCTVVPADVLQKCERFTAAGGHVLFLDVLPQWGISADEHARVCRSVKQLGGEITAVRPDNLLLGASVHATSTRENEMYSPAFLTNGSLETQFCWEGWRTDKLPATVEITPARPTELDRLDFYSRSEYEQRAFSVEYLASDGRWCELLREEDNTSYHAEYTFPPVMVHGLRITVESGSTKQPEEAGFTEIQGYRLGKTDFAAQLHRLVDDRLQIKEASAGLLLEGRYLHFGEAVRLLVNGGTEDISFTVRDREADTVTVADPADGAVHKADAHEQLTIAPGRALLLYLN